MNRTHGGRASKEAGIDLSTNTNSVYSKSISHWNESQRYSICLNQPNHLAVGGRNGPFTASSFA